MATNQHTVRNKEEFERRTLHGLMCEWKLAVSQLPALWMRPPIFVLKETMRLWGKWNRERREIAIRKCLVWDYPWTSVRDVLLHEMAHQLADEVWGGDAMPHGDLFQKACTLLHADPSATGDYVPLADRVRQEELSDDDRILLRIKKLLALAQSSNQHEAEAAMAKAHEHIAKYNVDLLATRERRTYCSVCVGEPAIRLLEHDYALAHLLCDFYFVEGIWLSVYVLEKGRMGRVLEISGLPENVKMAGYVHGFLRRSLNDQWAVFNLDGQRSHLQKTDFGVGLIQGFRQKIELQEREWQMANGSALALIKAGDTGLRGYFRERYPRIWRISGRQRMVDIDVQRAGEKVGRATVISRPIKSSNGNRRLLVGE